MILIETVAALVGYASLGLLFAAWLYIRADSVREEQLEAMNEQGFYNVDEYYEVAQDAQKALEGAYS